MKKSTITALTTILTLVVISVLAGAANPVQGYYYPSIIVPSVPAGLMPVVKGAEDVPQAITSLARQQIFTPRLSGQTAVIVKGKNLTSATKVTLGGKILKFRLLSQTRLQVAIPLNRFQYKSYKLCVAGSGPTLNCKQLRISQPVQ